MRAPEAAALGRSAASLLRRAAVVALATLAVAAAAQQPSLLENERAFGFSARPLDPSTIEARFAIADGYYLYRDKLKFSIEPGELPAPPVLPPGKEKQDEFFGRVETYRGSLAVKVVLPAGAPGRKVIVRAESQGCADVGVCYPPQLQKVELTLPAAGAGPGPLVEAAPARKVWFK